MKKQTLIPLLLLFTIINAFSQEITISGIVKDSVGKPMQYVNIGILNKPIGTVSDYEGHFYLSFDKSKSLDTLKISRLGYKAKIIVLKKVKNEIEITLLEKVEVLDEIQLSSKKMKIFEKGKLKTDTKQHVIFSQPNAKHANLGTEIGRKFKVGDKKPSILKSFKFYIKENDYKFSKFRINIYSLKKGLPYKRLCLKDIYTSVQDSYSGWVIINLESYDVIV